MGEYVILLGKGTLNSWSAISTAMLRASLSTAGEKHNPRNSRENVSQIGYPVLLSHLKVINYFSSFFIKPNRS